MEDIIQRYIKIILKYYKKGHKNSKCQRYLFIATGYSVGTESDR